MKLKNTAGYMLLALVVVLSAMQYSYAQTSMIRGDFALTRSRFIGVDMRDMKNNRSWAAGILMEHGSGDFDRHYRWHYGARVRHLHAERDEYYLDTLGQLNTGISSYTYNYFELPLGAEIDLLGGEKNRVHVGFGGDIFGAIPFGVSGRREYPDANPWSKEYETPYFILGFALTGYVGVNVGPIGIKAHYMGQFPFIPVVKPAPSSYTGPDYKPQLLGTRGLMISVFYVLMD